MPILLDTTTAAAVGKSFSLDTETGKLSALDDDWKALRDALVTKFGYPSKPKKEVSTKPKPRDA